MSVPAVFISGVKAAVLGAKALIPQIEGVTIKERINDHAVELNTCPTISLPLEKTCEMIRQSAFNTSKKRKEIEPFKISSPYNLKVKYIKPSM